MERNVTKAALDFIDNEKSFLIKDLENFIRIPSVSNDIKKVNEAMDYILELADSMGFRTERCAHNQVGVIEMGEGDETLGILAHIDVVPPGYREEWKTDPFKAEIIDGRMYGRGTLDDKGMVIASLYAMKAIKSLGLPMKKKVQMILGTQEETEWVDMDEYVKNYPLPDYGFTPDGEFPLQNIEKGICEIHIKLKADMGAGEPYVVSVQSGTAFNAVPSKAVCILSNGETIEVKGRTVHSSDPSRGDNALFNLNRELAGRGISDNVFTKVLRLLEEYFGDCYGPKLPIYVESEYYNGEFIDRNTFSPTIFTTDEEGNITVNVDVRFAYGTDRDSIVGCFENLVKDIGGSISVFSYQPAVFISRDEPYMKVFADAYEDVTGLKNEFTLAYGGSYAKAMPNIVSWGPIFPGEEDTCHEPNEYIPIESLLKATKIFTESIGEIVFNEKSFKK